MDEITIDLEYPLRLNDIEIREITLKRPKLGHFAKTQHLTGFDQSIRLIALCSGVAPMMVEQMDLVDLKKCSDFFDGLSGDDDNKSPL